MTHEGEIPTHSEQRPPSDILAFFSPAMEGYGALQPGSLLEYVT